MRRKGIALIVMLLFVGIIINQSIGNMVSFDDITPPVSSHSLNPPEPDGKNGWYVSDVEVTLNATDNESGVDRIEYRIEGSSWQTILGDNGTFIFGNDGDDVLIEYRGVDKGGNVESTNSFTIDIDQTPPVIEGITWEAYKEDGIWYIDLTASAADATSGIERVEFYINDVLQETISGSGPLYVCTFHLPRNSIQVIGFIRNLDSTEEYVNFTAMLVIALGTSGGDIHIKVCAYDFAGNVDCDEYLYPSHPIEPGIYLFENLTLLNDYTGYIGRFFICASFMSGIR
jgi:hypothetical protein